MQGRDAAQNGGEVRAFQTALSDLEDALELNMDRMRLMQQRIVELREALATGRRLSEVVPSERSPLLVEMLAQCADTLHSSGSRVRRTEARALHHEGLTMDQIARLFGVTRQRISALLRDKGEPGAR